MTIIGGPTWRLQLVTFECTWDVFANSSFNVAFQPILLHIIFVEGHYMLCSVEDFVLKKVVRSCLTMVWKSHVKGHTCWCACMVLTPCVCFASSVCLVILTVWLRQSLKLLSFKNITVHINLLPGVFYFLRSMFVFIQALHWLSLLSDILVLHDSNRDFHA